MLINRKGFEEHLLSLEGDVQVTVERKKKPRSDRQNAYYWGVMIDILAKHFGYTPDEMHESLKWQFLRVPDAPIPLVKSSAKLTTVEFEDYAANVRQWAAQEHSINIPLPNEVDFETYEKHL